MIESRDILTENLGMVLEREVIRSRYKIALGCRVLVPEHEIESGQRYKSTK